MKRTKSVELAGCYFNDYIYKQRSVSVPLKKDDARNPTPTFHVFLLSGSYLLLVTSSAI